MKGWIYEDGVRTGMGYGREKIEEKLLNRVVTEMTMTSIRRIKKQRDD